MESIFTQKHIKPNLNYHLVLSFNLLSKTKDISIHINGLIESQLSLSLELEPLEGNFYLGSESAVRCFKGSISDMVIFFKPLEDGDIKEIAVKGNGKKNSVQLLAEKQNNLEMTNSFSKKTGSFKFYKLNCLNHRFYNIIGVPLPLLKSFRGEDSGQFSPLASPTKKNTSVDDGNMSMNPNSVKRVAKLSQKLYSFLSQQPDGELFSKCRELAFNFEWVFVTLSMISPPLNDEGARLPYICLNSLISTDPTKPPPLYAIELRTFIKVLKQLDLKLSQDDICQLGKITESLKSEQFPELKVVKYDGKFLIYDKFLLVIRNAVLDPEEIRIIRENYRSNPLRGQEDDPDNTIEEKDEHPKTVFEPASQQSEICIDSLSKFSNEDQLSDLRLSSISYYFNKETRSPYELVIGYARAFDENELLVNRYSFENHQEKFSEGDLIRMDLNLKPHEYITKIVLNFTKDSKFLHSATFILQNNSKHNFSFLFDEKGLEFKPFPSEDFEICELECNESEIIIGFLASFIKNQEKNFLGGLGIRKIRKPIEKREDEEQLPAPIESWNQAHFQLIINHCAFCLKHQTTTWHEEADFAEKFNELTVKLKETFPNIEIIGNYDEPIQYAGFDVYIRGVGPLNERDNEARFYLFRKEESLREFKENFEVRCAQIYQNICLLIAGYGDTIELEKAQEDFFKRFQNFLPKRWEFSHEFPAECPPRAEKIKKLYAGLETGMDMVCKNWGCGKNFKFDENPLSKQDKCVHHPGRYEFGSIHGLWPESWTCCRGNWTARGCKRSGHKGVPISKDYKLCVNHGPLNPVKKKDQNFRPDSFCGRAYIEGDSSECRFHSGYIIINKITKDENWSCCEGPVGNCDPCFKSAHKFAEWPSEDAKIYFVQKAVVNPGIIRDYKTESFSKTAVWSGFFRKSEPYESKANKTKMKQQREIETENDGRYCLNWACEKVFKQSENKKTKTCRYHPGVWDFGHTGITVTQAVEEFSKKDSSNILWKPHWSCCRKPWENRGCTKGKHRGPLISEMSDRKYKWPSEQAQKYFSKRVSPFWLEKINDPKTRFDEEKMKIEWEKCVKLIGSGGV